MYDITDRKGLGEEFNQIDHDIQDEIKENWYNIIEECIRDYIKEY